MNKDNPKSIPRDERKRETQKTETLIVQLLLKCGLFLQREMNRVCEKYGLKQQQFSVLNEIVWQGPISQKELSEALLFEKSNTSKIVGILLKRNLIQVAVAPGDRRSTLLFETAEGGALWSDCMNAFHESSANFISYLSKDEALQAARLLKKLQRALKNKKEAEKKAAEIRKVYFTSP